MKVKQEVVCKEVKSALDSFKTRSRFKGRLDPQLGIENSSAAYLSGFVKTNEKLPKISFECVMKAAGLIEKMGKGRLKPRKD